MNALKQIGRVSIFLIALCLGGCNASVGMGVSVGVPIGNHGYMSVGTGRWF